MAVEWLQKTDDYSWREKEYGSDEEEEAPKAFTIKALRKWEEHV
jgi:hypothetical protein